MKKFLELISEEMGKGFEAAGYEAQLGRVTVSNRPDLCEYPVSIHISEPTRQAEI